jgi:hypothetical protein
MALLAASQRLKNAIEECFGEALDMPTLKSPALAIEGIVGVCAGCGVRIYQNLHASICPLFYSAKLGG